MRIRWSPEAAADFERIIARIHQDNPPAAAEVAVILFEGIESLTDFPHKGRIGRLDGTRELVCSPLPYVAVYRVLDETIQIARIYHGAQNR
jgi:toxin ParE1/3/4